MLRFKLLDNIWLGCHGIPGWLYKAIPLFKLSNEDVEYLEWLDGELTCSKQLMQMANKARYQARRSKGLFTEEQLMAENEMLRHILSGVGYLIAQGQTFHMAVRQMGDRL